MSYRTDNIDIEEYKFYVNRENEADRAYFNQMLYKDACYERCCQCELWDDEIGCSAGENIFNCTIV